jgi:hypothetical protein
VAIVAVTKTVDVARIKEALAAGARILGENRIQEAKEKKPKISEAADWHLIGHLQTNKARQAVTLFDTVHSLDSRRVARALDREAESQGKRITVMVQVNISGEESKFGVEPEETPELLREIAAMEHLAVEGLMTVPPFSDDPEASRPVYRRLRELRDRLAILEIPAVNLRHLSMGMSHDFDTAVEEGATLVRIGTGIFGERM